MKRIMAIALALALVLSLSLLLAACEGSAGAQGPAGPQGPQGPQGEAAPLPTQIEVSGTYAPISPPDPPFPDPSGGTVTYQSSWTIAWGQPDFGLTGNFVGTSFDIMTVVQYADGSSDLTVSSAFTGTFNGGDPGTALFLTTAYHATDGIFQGTMLIFGTGGGLANLHGAATVSGLYALPPSPFSYSGTVYLD